MFALLLHCVYHPDNWSYVSSTNSLQKKGESYDVPSLFGLARFPFQFNIDAGILLPLPEAKKFFLSLTQAHQRISMVIIVRFS